MYGARPYHSVGCRITFGFSWSSSSCFFLFIPFMYLESWELVGEKEVNGAQGELNGVQHVR